MRPRPRVELVAPLPPDRVLERFEDRLEHAERCDGSVGRRELSLVVRDGRAWWSPAISLEVEPHPEGSVLRGRFGPHPELWTLFVGIYATLVFAFVAGSTWGFVQLTLGQPATGLWLGGGALMGLTVACSVDLAGRRMGAGQMDVIRGFVTDVLPEGQPRDKA